MFFSMFIEIKSESINKTIYHLILLSLCSLWAFSDHCKARCVKCAENNLRINYPRIYLIIQGIIQNNLTMWNAYYPVNYKLSTVHKQLQKTKQKIFGFQNKEMNLKKHLYLKH